ncbi:pollen receptor-like kinase 2 [Olea europaea subsp. europaea]|uniref:Pollen receptor-like kinase 2 n=1 Tax=Olea europaea subsp. europaea TaxID=158383 RepID=A0A8S0TMG9_OLEEU|nr:pollen receptor-like kinase 2 [Olea europaea subsp. europaea]
MERGSSSPENSTSSKKSDQNVKLTFLKEDREHFDMTSRLKSSVEILGNGVFRSYYKAALNADQVTVVKRFRHMNSVGKTDFHEHMRSLAFHLHGNRTRGHPSLDWPARLNIIKGVSKGLLCLHNELPSLMASHGHLKSSNVLLDKSYNPLLTDYALIPVVNQQHAQDHITAYKSPEYMQTDHAKNRRVDTWNTNSRDPHRENPIKLLATRQGKRSRFGDVGRVLTSQGRQQRL